MWSIGGVLTPAEVATLREQLARESFVDGLETASGRARAVKNNLQLASGSEAEATLGLQVRRALERSQPFLAAAVPLDLTPIRFSRYENGMTYGWHTDGALMVGMSGRPLRSDLACTIFLTDPATYTGGELVIQSPLGNLRVKLAAGDAVLYAATSVHRVEPVTAGTRLVALTWVQSAIHSGELRQLSFELVQAIRDLQLREPDAPELDRLNAVYQNLIRFSS